MLAVTVATFQVIVATTSTTSPVTLTTFRKFSVFLPIVEIW